MPLFTDMSLIDHYVIKQSIELANNMTYMREAKPLGAFLLLSLSQSCQPLSLLPNAKLPHRSYLQHLKENVLGWFELTGEDVPQS